MLADHLDDVSRGEALDLAAVTDGLRAEREQGITIDVAYRYFSTARRSFILADTPGHERYTRNMFTGASTADVVLVLIDARTGVTIQTRRHAHIAALLGIEHIVACVNKVDLVNWNRERFEEIADQVYDVIRRLGAPDLTVIPISALHGDNVAASSGCSSFYGGPTLLDYLEEVGVQADRDLSRLRLPVQWVGRPLAGESRLYMGRIVGGTLAPGDEVVVLPAGTSTTITELDTLDRDPHRAVPPMSVTFELADRVDVGRGDVLVAPSDQPVSARELDCTLCWMSEEPLHPGRRHALKHTTRTVRATVQEISGRTDPETLEREIKPTSLAVNDIGRVRLRTNATVVVVSLISPLAADRAHLRKAHEEANLLFVEVFVDTPVEICERRDPKGLYARARAGEIEGFTGVDAPYESPEHPELRVDTLTTSAPQAVSQVVEVLRARPRVLAKGATMRISTKADYAVRAAIELAAAPDDKPVAAEWIATSQGLPVSFLEHILSELTIAGVVRRQRGTDPGYRLAKDPRQVTIADIIRAVEGPLATVRGGKPEDADYPGAARQLPRVWIAVRQNLRSVFEHVTVADIAKASLPDSINLLADDPEAWVTRPPRQPKATTGIEPV